MSLIGPSDVHQWTGVREGVIRGMCDGILLQHVDSFGLFCENALVWNKLRQKTRMWASAQRDGRPVKYRWRPLFNATKFGWRPVSECRAVTLPRCKSHWNLQGCPKLANRSQPLVGWSSPYYEDMRRRYRCLTNLFSDCQYMPQLRRCSPTKLCDDANMACSTFQTCILNLH